MSLVLAKIVEGIVSSLCQCSLEQKITHQFTAKNVILTKSKWRKKKKKIDNMMSETLRFGSVNSNKRNGWCFSIEKDSNQWDQFSLIQMKRAISAKHQFHQNRCVFEMAGGGAGTSFSDLWHFNEMQYVGETYAALFKSKKYYFYIFRRNAVQMFWIHLNENAN